MKKAVSILCAILLMVSVLAVGTPVSADPAEDFSYTVVGDEVRLEFCRKKGDVVIPETIEGYPVTMMSSSFFLTEGEGVTSVTIPKTLTSIHVDALWMGKDIENFYVDEANPNYACENGVLFNKDKTRLLNYPRGRKDTHYTVPASVRVLANDSFYGNPYIKGVTLPDGLTQIGSWTFQECTALETLVIPNNVGYIGESAFFLCESLKLVYMSKNVYKIIMGAFSSNHEDLVIGVYKDTYAEEFFGEYKYIRENLVLAPSVLSKNETSITLVSVPGYEYSIDGKVWQKESVFTGLTNNTEYVLYQRIAEDDTYMPSFASEGLIVKTGIDKPVVKTKPAKITKVVLKASKRKLTVTWKKDKNAKKYVVKYSYKKNMKSAKTKTVTKNKAVIKKLKSGKKVYVQVQGINGKLKGKFSSKKFKKIK